jgi:hypothetical protein
VVDPLIKKRKEFIFETRHLSHNSVVVSPPPISNTNSNDKMSAEDAHKQIFWTAKNSLPFDLQNIQKYSIRSRLSPLIHEKYETSPNPMSTVESKRLSPKGEKSLTDLIDIMMAKKNGVQSIPAPTMSKGSRVGFDTSSKSISTSAMGMDS